MRIGQAMTRDVVTAGPDENLKAAAERMLETGVGMLPVCENERLIGVVTDRDLTVRAVAKGLDPRTATVRQTMTPQIFYCFDDETVAEAGRKMEERAVRRLVVLDREKRLVGVISLDDLATLPGVGEVLDHVAEPRPEATQ
ncbi:MAG: CBS domain-containing protein [Myxococcaceae bacterium]